MPDYTIILLVILLAAFVRVVAGFGDALIGMPILLNFFSLDQADSIVSTYGLLLGLIMSKHYWQHIKLFKKELACLLGFSAIGIFCGAYALKNINPEFLILALSGLLILYPLIYLYSNELVTIKEWRAFSIIAGFIGGFLGGSVNTNGPPFVIYGQMRKWTPTIFIAIIQPLFLFGNLVNIISYTTFEMYSYYHALLTLFSFPIVWVAYQIGLHVRPKIENYFAKVVVSLIFFSGVMTLYTHLTNH